MLAKTLEQVCDALQEAWRQQREFRICGYVTSSKTVYDYHLAWFPIEAGSASVYDRLLAASREALQPSRRDGVFQTMRAQAPTSVTDDQLNAVLEKLYQAYERRLEKRASADAPVSSSTRRDLVPGSAWADMLDATQVNLVQLSMARRVSAPVLRTGVAKSLTLEEWAESLLPLGTAQPRLVLREGGYDRVELV